MSNIIKYKMNLEVLTPLHIGGADYKSNITKKEYLFEKENEGKIILRIADGQKFIDYLIKNKLFDKYISLINESVNEKVKIHRRNISLEEILTRLKISTDDFKNNFQKKVYVITDIKNDIKLVLRNLAFKPYIPGSSIKGALVNFLLIDYIIKNRNEFSIEKKDILLKAQSVKDDKNIKKYKEDVKKIINKIEKSIIYGNDEKLEKSKRFGISVSESYNYYDTKTNFYQDIDEKRNPKKESEKSQTMPAAREYIMANSKFDFDIILDLDLLRKSKLKIGNINDLIISLEKATDYLVNKVLEDKNSPQTENLILGANTGFLQKTIVYALFEDKKERLEVIKKLLHRSSKNLIGNHLNDKISPRVLNKIEIHGKNQLTGLVKIKKVEEKNVGKN